MNLPESDWKHLSRLRPLALDRLCRRILQEAEAIIASAADRGNHRAYLDLYQHLREQDRVVADCFDNWRRSQGFFLLSLWHRHGLITDEELAGFTPEIQERVAASLPGQE